MNTCHVDSHIKSWSALADHLMTDGDMVHRPQPCSLCRQHCMLPALLRSVRSFATVFAPRLLFYRLLFDESLTFAQ